MIRYYDASALAKRFVQEPGSDAVARWLRQGRLVTNRLAWIEVVAAVARRAREGALTPGQFRGIARAVATEARKFSLVELTAEVETTARRLLADHALRAADAVHLAACIELAASGGRPVDFICFDAGLALAARRAGIRVLGARAQRLPVRSRAASWW